MNSLAMVDMLPLWKTVKEKTVNHRGSIFMPHKEKLNYEAKVEIVRRCISGEIGVKEAGREVGVGSVTIRRWLARYESEGGRRLFTAGTESLIQSWVEASGGSGVSKRGLPFAITFYHPMTCKKLFGTLYRWMEKTTQGLGIGSKVGFLDRNILTRNHRFWLAFGGRFFL